MLEEKLIFYLEIHQMAKKKLFSFSYSKQFKISRTTVYKYLDMTFEEAQQSSGEGMKKTKKLDQYLDWILAWLEEYPHLSAAQIKYWF